MSTASICITKCIPGVTRNAEKLQQSGNCIWVIWRNQTLITSSVTTDPNRRCFEVVFEMDKHEGIWSTTWKLILKVILQSVEADPALLSLLLHPVYSPEAQLQVTHSSAHRTQTIGVVVAELLCWWSTKQSSMPSINAQCINAGQQKTLINLI